MILLIVLAGCAGGRMEPAQRAISDIDAVLTAAATEAREYAPERLADAQARLDGLRTVFRDGDYAAVLAAAPAVMSLAQAVSGASAARKNQILKSLGADWSALAGLLPGRLAALQERIEMLARRSGKGPQGGVDLEAARSRWSHAASTWSKAQAAFAIGNLPEAVATARGLKATLEDLAGTLGMHADSGPVRSTADPAR